MKIDNNLKEKLNQLLEYRTSNNYGIVEFNKCSEYLISLMRSVGFHIKIINKEKKPILLGEIKTSTKSKFCLLIYGHYDIQDAGNTEQWEFPPYKLSIKKDRLFGRGICDSKGNILANLLAIKEFLEEKANSPHINIKYIIEGEEEIGSPQLIKNINKIKKFLQDVDLCMFPGESTVRDDVENLIIPTGYKGCLLLMIKFFHKKNQSFHSSFGRLVESPAYLLVRFIQQIKIKFDALKIYDIKKYCKNFTNYEKNLIKSLPYKFNNNLLSNSQKIELFLKPVCNLIDFKTSNNISSQKLVTAIPNEAQAIIDLRLIPNLKTNLVMNLIKRLIKDFFEENNLKTLSFQIKSIVKLEYGYSTFQHNVLKKINNSFLKNKVCPNKIFFLPLAPGSGPQYYLCTQFNIPTFVAGVGYSGSNIHSINENIRINDFFFHIKFLKNLLNELSK